MYVQQEDEIRVSEKQSEVGSMSIAIKEERNMTQEAMEHCKNTCNELGSFKRIVQWAIGLQITFTMICLTVCLNVISTQSINNQKLTELSTKQKSINEKAERAREDALKALATSGRAESNIAWIREGLTELKISVREFKNDRKP